MKSRCKYNQIIFIIALKRYKKNSVIYKKPKYILCKQFNLSVNTFSKYLTEAINNGFIIEEKDCYKIIKFKKIVKQLLKGSNVCFNNHKMIKKSKSTDFKQIQNEFEQLLIVDNIIDRQQKKIDKKAKFVNDTQNYRFHNLKFGTGNTSKEELSMIHRDKTLPKRVRKKDVLEKSDFLFNNQIMSSARNVSKKLGMSVSKANKILNRKNFFLRKPTFFWLNGCNLAIYEYAINMYPEATVIPCSKINRIKVHFGSELNLLD